MDLHTLVKGGKSDLPTLVKGPNYIGKVTLTPILANALTYMFITLIHGT